LIDSLQNVQYEKQHTAETIRSAFHGRPEPSQTTTNCPGNLFRPLFGFPFVLFFYFEISVLWKARNDLV
jgi:hypothetical protein